MPGDREATILAGILAGIPGFSTPLASRKSSEFPSVLASRCFANSSDVSDEAYILSRKRTHAHTRVQSDPDSRPANPVSEGKNRRRTTTRERMLAERERRERRVGESREKSRDPPAARGYVEGLVEP